MTAASGELRFSDHLHAGDLVVVGQGVVEPTALLERLIAERPALPEIEIFTSVSISSVFTEDVARSMRLVSSGAAGTLARLVAAGLVSVIPCHYADIARALRARAPGRIVSLVQLTPADVDGYHGLGLAVDYNYDLMPDARLVIAEINDQLPPTIGPRIPGSLLSATISTSRPPPTVAAATVTSIHRRIAAQAMTLVPNGAVIELGIGAVPAALGSLLTGHRELRVHSGLVGDWLLELARAGALATGPGAAIAGAAMGSPELYEYVTAHVEFRPIAEITALPSLIGREQLIAINSAFQVDLSGQVNAEMVGRRYLGSIGGQVDFLRGAQVAKQGVSAVLLPATAAQGTRSRIVNHLDEGVVTTGRSTVDFVVTEYGVADLRGRDLNERAAALIAVAAPEHRPALGGPHLR